MKGPNINFEEVSLSLANTPILEDISLQIKRGEIHCLIGPNGGGKTSLLRALLGQMPHRGEISIDWSQDSIPGDSTLGYVPQLLNLEKTLPLTVDDFMAISCQRYRPVFFGAGSARKRAIREALDRVGLAEEKRNRPLGSLSGGERQRLLFAQAMIPEPSLLILDEPLNSLDESGAKRIIDLIRELSSAGTTVLWVVHNLALVKEVAQSVSAINRKLLFSGPVDEVLDEMSPDILFQTDAFTFGGTELQGTELEGTEFEERTL